MFNKLIPETKNEIVRRPDTLLSAVTVPSSLQQTLLILHLLSSF